MATPLFQVWVQIHLEQMGMFMYTMAVLASFRISIMLMMEYLIEAALFAAAVAQTGHIVIVSPYKFLHLLTNYFSKIVF